MPFTLDQIENGGGTPTAVVYAPTGTADPIAPAVAYLALAGKTAFANATSPKQMTYLRNGTVYVENLARPRVLGWPMSTFQQLLFPRFDIAFNGRYLDVNEIPTRYLWSIWEATELAASGEPLGDIVETRDNVQTDATAGIVTTYFAPGKSARREYPQIQQWIAPFLRPYGMVVRG